MNRKQKIIVSVTGIFLVMLILVGLTYAYFLTQITGNTNPRSISVTTANLQLIYGDGNGILEVGDKLRPGDDVTFKDAGGNDITEKTFTVTNNGDTTDYVVIVDNVSITKDGAAATFKSNDFIYTLTCSSSDSNSCDGIETSTFPLKNQSILVGNNIAAGAVHTYTLTMEYKETNQNQSDDMGKSFTARINIEDIRRLENPYKDNTNSLAYHIINNSVNAANGTKLVASPPTKIGNRINLNWSSGTQKLARHNVYHGLTFYQEYFYYSSDYNLLTTCVDSYGEDCNGVNKGNANTTCNDLIGNYFYSTMPYSVEGYADGCLNGEIPAYYTKPESVLSVTEDDYGTSYYYRGVIEDNFVEFNNMCWRIVRIEGDGSVKLVLTNDSLPCNSDFSRITMLATEDQSYLNINSMFNKADEWFNYVDSNSNYRFPENIKSKIKNDTTWCLRERTTSDEDTFKCNNNNYLYEKNYIGTLTLDELIYAGRDNGLGTYNVEYYLNQSYCSYPENIILTKNLDGSPYTLLDCGDQLETSSAANSFSPVISLKSGITISDGVGTIDDPYVISVS